MDGEKNQTAVAKWNDIISICKNEAEDLLKETKLSFAVLYPINICKTESLTCIANFRRKNSYCFRNSRIEGNSEVWSVSFAYVEMFEC